MRQKYWYLGSICSVAMTVASIIACGGDPSLGEEECTLDIDCSFGVCDNETGYCVDTCLSDTDCLAGEICQTRPSAPGSTDKTCQADPDSNNNSGQCQDNEDCNADEVCLNSVCTVTTPQNLYRYIQVLDTSSGDSSCNSTTSNGLKDAGSDIFSVELLDSQSQVIGYGRTLFYEEGTGEIDTTDYGIFDGSARNVDARQCPVAEGGTSFRRDSVVSLGCGGYMIMEFVGSDRQAVNIDNGMTVVVGEYAPICNQSGGSSTGSDRYTVNVCTDNDSTSNGSDSSCTTSLGGSLGGNGDFTIRGL